MGINDRELVCTIVDLGSVVWVVGGGQHARRGQRGAEGKMEGTLEQVARDCSRELEGKEELGVEKGLFIAVLSAPCGVVGRAGMTSACVSKREVRNGGKGDGGVGWRRRVRV